MIRVESMSHQSRANFQAIRRAGRLLNCFRDAPLIGAQKRVTHASCDDSRVPFHFSDRSNLQRFLRPADSQPHHVSLRVLMTKLIVLLCRVRLCIFSSLPILTLMACINVADDCFPLVLLSSVLLNLVDSDRSVSAITITISVWPRRGSCLSIIALTT